MTITSDLHHAPPQPFQKDPGCLVAGSPPPNGQEPLFGVIDSQSESHSLEIKMIWNKFELREPVFPSKDEGEHETFRILDLQGNSTKTKFHH